MNPPPAEQKTLLRRQLRAALSTMSFSERAAASEIICTTLLQSQLWLDAQQLLLFAPLSTEPDITPTWPAALAQGKTVCLPRYDPVSGCYTAAPLNDPKSTLAPGRYGILEPVTSDTPIDLNRLDLILVPGLGFGPDGRRLGRGKGYYDRLLAGLGAVKCGVGFDQQWSDSIPHEARDVMLDVILTPGRGLVWSRPRF